MNEIVDTTIVPQDFEPARCAKEVVLVCVKTADAFGDGAVVIWADAGYEFVKERLVKKLGLSGYEAFIKQELDPEGWALGIIGTDRERASLLIRNHAPA